MTKRGTKDKEPNGGMILLVIYLPALLLFDRRNTGSTKSHVNEEVRIAKKEKMS